MPTRPGTDHPDLAQRWSGAHPLVILDMRDFPAAGEGFLTAWQAWRDQPGEPLGRPALHYLALAARLPPAAAMPAVLAATWPPALDGMHRLQFQAGRVMLEVLVGAAPRMLAQLEARVDLFVGAELAPAPAALARLARRGASLAIAGADQAQRRLWIESGFACAPLAADGVLTAAYQGHPPVRRRGATGATQVPIDATHPADHQGGGTLPGLTTAVPERHAIVIGAGLAGAAACERLAARGWQVTLIERQPAPAREASGNLAGIYMPQLALDDNPAARLSRAAYLFALRQWQRLGGVGTAFGGAACGVLQLARDPAHAEVQRRIAASGAWPAEYARWLDSADASSVLGAAAPDGAWLFSQGGWAHPAGVCQAMLAACGARLTRRFCCTALALHQDGGAWRVAGADGVLLARAPVVILANGAAATGFAQAAGLPLAAVRGQVTHLDAALAAHCLGRPALVVCRDAYLTPPAGGVVSVGASYDADADPDLRAASQAANLAHGAALFGRRVAPALAAAPLAGRTGFRCVAPDRLPLVGALPDPASTGRAERLRDIARYPGLYGLLGYASRGLIWAPLAAELLASQLDGEPLPVESSLAAALDPARFLLKQLRRRP